MKQNVIARRAFLCSSLITIGCRKAPEKATGTQQTPASQKTKLVDEPQVKRIFDKDGRSKKVIFVAHCMLNQNARHVDCADFPAMMKPLVAALDEKKLGIIQLPCPELMALGLGRDRDVPPLDTIREGLELPEAQVRLKSHVDQIVYQIKEYRWQGFHVVGILGKNGSPSCGVETTSYKAGPGPGEGVFIRLLRQRLEAEGLDIGLKGIDDHRQGEAIDWVSKRV